ncbi:sulfite exporter TauE/SafE family protein [Halosimplex litoreum]|uniref:Sulfite exporter TauE/SafE family protein n=1 Tax=Halosimplex litoreum TaxID=1198301 RepID=A0A7T3KUU4_9EURY|nr:sulfite exporter TauE/SafE family protein [Halosimplex litoreum]QPV62622.1 sulfite exporter TauE/SafE family protein [Halosimplex litoreum]
MTPLQAATTVGSADAGLAVFALVGLLGGAHCLGMCGPLVTLYADRLGDDGPAGFSEIRQHLLFNLGRTASYALIGALMGALGTVLYDAAGVAAIADDVRAVAGVLVGGFILLTGATYALTGSTAGALGHAWTPSAFERVSSALMARVDRWVRGPRIAALGAVHGLLPCPLLYPAFLYAFATGSPVYGALALATLGLATVPAVFAYGVAFGAVSPRVQGPLHRALGVAFLIMGYLPLAHGLMLLGIHLPHPPLPAYQPLG